MLKYYIMKFNIIGYVIVALILVICLRIYQESDFLNLKCIISNVDGKKYCVRERNKLVLAADRLATVNNKMGSLVKFCHKNYPDRENIKRLAKGYNTQEYRSYRRILGELQVSIRRGTEDQYIHTNRL